MNDSNLREIKVNGTVFKISDELYEYYFVQHRNEINVLMESIHDAQDSCSTNQGSCSTSISIVPDGIAETTNVDNTKEYLLKNPDVILHLIDLVALRNDKFKDIKWKNKDVWDHIASELNMEFETSFMGPQISQKWYNLTKKYRDTVDHNAVSGNDRKTCPYYNELGVYYGNKPNVKPVFTAGSISDSSSSKDLKEKYGRKQKASNVQKPCIPEVSERPQEDDSEDRTMSLSGDEATEMVEQLQVAKKSRKRLRVHSEPKNDMLQSLKSFQMQIVELEERKLEAAQTMHKEKMDMLKEFITAMKK